MKIIDSITLSTLTRERFKSFLFSFVRPNSTVLEIGAGDGKLADEFTEKESPASYQIFDLKDERCYAKSLPWQRVDASKDIFPLQDKSLDMVITAQVIEHLENLSHFFRECYRVLKDDGYLIIKFPNFSNLFQRMYFFKNGIPTRLGGRIGSGGHINFLPYGFLLEFAKTLFIPEKITGDISVDLVFYPKISKGLFGNQKFIIFPKLQAPFLSYNVMICFKKIKI